MGQIIRVCLFDEVRSPDHPFDGPFKQLENVRVIDTFSTWEPLHECLVRREVDVIAVNLDGETALEVVQGVARKAPECGTIGISTEKDAAFIIKAMRAGCGQLVCAPVEQEDLRNALQRVRPIRAQARHPSRRICVVGSSGGAGTTTVACNLSMELAHLTGQKIALVDLNLEYGDVSCSFDCAAKYSIADICGEGVDLDLASVQAVLHELSCGVSLIARPELLEEAREVSPDGVDGMFRLLSELFPYVVVDLPRAYSFLGTLAVRRAEYVLIVTQLGVPFIRNARRIYETLIHMGADPDRVQIVLNRSNAEYERITVKDVEEHFRREVFAVIPNDYQFVSASLDLGHPIGADAPSSKCRTAIQEMARKLAPDYSTADATDAPGSGFLGKLLGRRQKATKT